jgi:hypothetical protein
MVLWDVTQCSWYTGARCFEEQGKLHRVKWYGYRIERIRTEATGKQAQPSGHTKLLLQVLRPMGEKKKT